jgi:Mg-chelatase subunit ChlD
MSTAITKGSLAQIAQVQGTSLAESFLSTDAIIIIDVSGSMSMHDSRGGKSRYDTALEELAQLQAKIPGKCAVIAFSDSALFIPGGLPPLIGGGTNLAAALRFARVADVEGMQFVVISDGEPDDQCAALSEAAQYKNRISTIFVGPEEDWASGRKFLAQLAAKSGGQAITADRACELADKTERLLLTA